jgi:hypothetical protein
MPGFTLPNIMNIFVINPLDWRNWSDVDEESSSDVLSEELDIDYEDEINLEI